MWIWYIDQIYLTSQGQIEIFEALTNGEEVQLISQSDWDFV